MIVTRGFGNGLLASFGFGYPNVPVGGRKKRELNPLIKVKFGNLKEPPEPNVVEQVVVDPVVKSVFIEPEISFLPVEKRKQVKQVVKKEVDALLAKVSKQVALPKEDDEEVIIMLMLSLDD